MPNQYLFTSESVTEGHPDKMADQISDAILDAVLKQDDKARVAIEALVTTGLALVAGEMTTKAYVDIPHVVRETIRGIGYRYAEMGCDADTMAVLTTIDEQSPDIARGVDQAWEAKQSATADEIERLGAGDQGMVFGYACRETPELMPLPISLAHALSRRLAEVRKTGRVPFLWPDGKTQVTVAYRDGQPIFVDTVVVSAQHQPDVSTKVLQSAIVREVVQPVLGQWITSQTRVLINPTGRFVVGGPHGDTGLTGRKIIVDTYGGSARHGGGAYSGKDPTKVDRSASYAARWVAKNLVASGLADQAEVQVAYAIGVARPVSVMVNTFGSGKLEDSQLSEIVGEVFDLRPLAIIRALDLMRPLYLSTAAYGHFGRTDLNLPWEATNRVEAILAAVRARV